MNSSRGTGVSAGEGIRTTALMSPWWVSTEAYAYQNETDQAALALGAPMVVWRPKSTPDGCQSLASLTTRVRAAALPEPALR